MEKEKRELYLWEKALNVFAIMLCLVGLVLFVISYTNNDLDWLSSVAWIFLSVCQIIHHIIRWENRRKANVVFIWLWSILLVAHLALLISRLFSAF